METFNAHANLIDSQIDRRRARHAVSENQRTLEAVSALENGDLEKLDSSWTPLI